MKYCVIFITAVIAVASAQNPSTNGSSTLKPTTQTTTPTTTPTTVTSSAPNTTAAHTSGEPVTTAPVPSNHTLPAPKVGQWSVKKNKTVCILVDMAATVQVDKQTTMAWNLAPNATASGDCGDVDYIEWEVHENLMLRFTFSKSSDQFMLQNITTTYMKEAATATPSDVAAGLTNSYRCNATSTVQIYGSSYNSTLTLSNVMLQAFRNKDNTVFDEAIPCAADRPTASNIVPIAVGAALAGLVVIVLIAYLIGRRQNRQGYESV